jgi:hypothetical protein
VIPMKTTLKSTFPQGSAVISHQRGFRPQ